MKSVRQMAMNSASKTTPCPDCNGQGRHSRDSETGYERVCDRCKGSGVVMFAKCHRRQSAAKLLIGDEARRMSVQESKLNLVTQNIDDLDLAANGSPSRVMIADLAA